jgi:4-amino-4-deoxy-L-arabinose transferase-like glycosyltransferase
MSEAGAQPKAGRDRSPREFALILTLIVGAAVVIRILFVVLVDPAVPRIGDASAYHLLAEHLARGDGYIRPFDSLLLHKVRATAEYPPLFPMLLAVPARLGIHGVESQRMLMSFVGGATVALIGLLGRRVGGSAVGLLAAAIAACSPMLFQSEGMLMAETLYVPLVVVVLLSAYRAYDSPTMPRAAWLGAAIGLATLARAEGLLLGIIVAVPLFSAMRALAWRTRMMLVGVTLGVAVLLLVPWTVRNVVKFDAFVPVSNNSATLVDGANCDATYGGSQLGLWRETFTQAGDTARALPQSAACFEGFDIGDPNFDEVKVASKHRRDGIDYARDHLGSQPKVMAVRVLRTWALYAPHQQVNFETLEGRPHEWQWRGTILHWTLLPFAIAGMVLLVRRRVQAWPLAAAVIAVSITAALTYGQQRFRVAAEPAIYVLAAVAIVAVVRAARTRARP